MHILHSCFFSLQSIQNLFTKICDSHFSSFQGTLSSGTLSDSIMLFPSPQVSCSSLLSHLSFKSYVLLSRTIDMSVKWK